MTTSVSFSQVSRSPKPPPVIVPRDVYGDDPTPSCRPTLVGKSESPKYVKVGCYLLPVGQQVVKEAPPPSPEFDSLEDLLEWQKAEEYAAAAPRPIATPVGIEVRCAPRRSGRCKAQPIAVPVGIEVRFAASRARCKRTGAVAWDAITNHPIGGELRERFPIMEFMDFDDQTFTLDEVTKTVNHWIEVAEKFPHVRRNCLCCNSRAKEGKVLCNACHKWAGPTIYAK